MAVLAMISICTIVFIILAVATDTADGKCHLIVRRRFMALRTADVLVLPFQFEIGSIVVEIPIFPIARIVAIATIRAQRALMDVLLFVAGTAIRLGILKCSVQMTFLAFCQQVLPGKRKARHPMVEIGFFPGLFMMARFAFLALLPFVLVILLVA